MEAVLQLLQQIATMFLLAGAGFLLFKSGKVSQEGSRSIGNIMIYLSLPAVIIRSFMVEKTPSMLEELGISALLAAAALALCILISRLIFKKDAVASLASSFSNPGFFGVPLVIASLGQDCVPFMAAYIAFLNLLQFTYGVSVLTEGRKKVSLRTILKAPFLTAIVIGLILFFTQVRLPALVTKTISYCAELNTPLAMFAVGIYLAQTDLKKMFLHKKLYLIAAVRLILIPLICLVLFSLVPQDLYTVKMAVLICVACPVGSNVAVYAHLYGGDYRYGVETVVISTALSIITIPALDWLAQLLWY